MGIGGGIITKKLLFVALLIASLSIGGIAAADAAEVNATQTQTSDTNTLNKEIINQSKSEKNLNNSTRTQIPVDKSVKKVKKSKKTKYKKQVNTQSRNKAKVKHVDTNTLANVQKKVVKQVSSTKNGSIVKQETVVKTIDTQNVVQNTSTVNDSKSTTENISINETTKDTFQIPVITNKTEPTTTVTTQTTTEKPVANQTTATNLVTTKNTDNTQNVSSESPVSSTAQNQPTANNTIKEPLAAAGETKTVSVTQYTQPNTFTVDQIEDAASRVKSYVETNKKLPNYVTIGSVQVKMPDFLQLLTAGLLQINSGTNNPITPKTVNNATTPTESIRSGTITKASYLDLAKRVNAYIKANGKLPNYASSTLGKMSYQSLIYTFSKVLSFEKVNDRLPGYVSVKPWNTIGSVTVAAGAAQTTTVTPVPADLQKYLAATANCQVNDSKIKSLAASITAGKTTTYDKAVAIFNWVNSNLSYSFYYNTKYGAVGALNAKTGNCVDTAHLVIAITRAAGIPARYEHVRAQFTSGNWYGHVIAQVYVNGKWYYADASSNYNKFGVINNWNTATATIKGYYASLPF